MSTYDQIVSLPLCAALTGLGLVLSYFVMRRRGLGAGLRGFKESISDDGPRPTGLRYCMNALAMRFAKAA